MTGPLAYLNGAMIPATELTISYADAGFAAGASVTDFCRAYAGVLFRWGSHHARFRRDCAWLGVALPPAAELADAAGELVRANAMFTPARDLAVVSFATPGPLGYLLGRRGDGPPTVALHTVALDPARYDWGAGAAVRAVGDWPAGEFWPASVKHRSRVGWYQAARHPALEPGELAALLAPGGVADTPVGSVAYWRGGVALLPPAGAAFDGVSLAVLAEACALADIECREEAVDFRRVAAGAACVDEVWLAGSGFGVAAARRASWGGAARAFAAPGPGFARARAAWDALVARETLH